MDLHLAGGGFIPDCVDRVFEFGTDLALSSEAAIEVTLPNLFPNERVERPTITFCGGPDAACGPKVTVLTIPRLKSSDSSASESKPLTWVHLESPSDAIIEWAEETFSISHVELKNWMSERDPRDSFRYKKCLVAQCFSVAASDSAERSLSATRHILALGNDFFITISNGRSDILEHLMENIANETVPRHEFETSNALAVSITGATIINNELQLEKISEGFAEYMNQSLSTLPSAADSAKVRDMTKHMWLASKIMSGFDDVLEVLGDRDNLFQEPHRRDSLRRYLRIVDAVESNIKQTREMVEDLQRAWLTQSERWQNQVVFRIGVISGISTPLVLLSSICGMNFQNPLPDWAMWGGLAGAAAVGIGLVAGLFVTRRRDRLG